MKDYVRHRRKNASIYTWECKLYIPVPLSTKVKVETLARENCMSQAELGAVVVMHYVDHVDMMSSAIEEYRKAKSDVHKEDVKRQQAKAEGGHDRTFGAVFKSTFGEYDDE